MAKHRALVLAIFVLFLLFHQADRFVISAVAPQVMEDFHVEYFELGLVFSLTGFIAAILYPVWGFLYDRYSRRLLVSLAAVVWGFTSLINALSRSFAEFFATRLSTAVDDAAPPGMSSLVLDYFEPERRARAMGILNTTGPLGAILGTVLSLSLVSAGLSWRYAFYITGSIGIVTGLLLYLFVRDVPRGSSEPELKGLLSKDVFKAKVSDLVKLTRNKSLLLLYLQGFWGVFPWAAITYWIITYMQNERGMSPEAIMVTMVAWLVMMAAGNLFAGYMGDALYRRTIRGRAIYGAIIVFLSAVLILLTMRARSEWEFFIFGIATAFVIPQAGPQVSAMWGDIVEPELRSSAASFQAFFENIGSSFAPAIAGYLAARWSLGEAILWIGVSTWLLCFAFFTLVAIRIPKEAGALRELLRARADKLAGAGATLVR
ncbi:MAG: MFS transporter [Thermofilaceae archaeon]